MMEDVGPYIERYVCDIGAVELPQFHFNCVHVGGPQDQIVKARHKKGR